MRGKQKKVKGISLIVLIVTIVVIIILATGIIMAVLNNNPISNAKEAVLRNDLQVMKEAYGMRTGELLLKYEGDTSKITEEDYLDIVIDKYKGEVYPYLDGLSYVGKDKRRQEVAESMGYIIGNPNDAVLRAWGENARTDFHAEEYRTKITKIKFITSNKVPDNVIKSWDVSERNNGGVMAWIVSDGESDYELTIGGNTKVVANKDSSSMFYKFTALKEIDIKVLDTSHSTNMTSMFNQCNSLTSIDFGSKFDTSKVETMGWMFYGCESLTSIDFGSKFDTSKVTSMESMFRGCGSLKDLNLSNFNTSEVTNMEYMFEECESLASIDFGSKFDANKVTSMAYMFAGCSSLKDLNLSNVSTSEITNMSSMFSECASLTSINFGSKFNTSKVTSMAYMFRGCGSLKDLNLSSFNTSSVTTMKVMFYECFNLTNIDVSHFNTSEVTDMESMFYKCHNLTYLDLSNFDTSKVTNMAYMFYRNFSLTTSITIRNVNTTSYNWMFFGAASLRNGEEIIVNYTEETEELVDEMIKTKVQGEANVKKGEKVSIN